MRSGFVILPALMIASCQHNAPSTGEPGTPLPGLNQADSARFDAGRTLFNRIFTPEEGLGPAYNENQCSACHTVPAVGGSTGFERVVKATRYAGPGACDPLSSEGGENIRSQATPLLRAHGVARESIPPRATEIGRFLPPFLFGLGLVEAISEDVIMAGADPEDRDGDGVSGRAARGPDGRLTRFGRKADFATIEEFTRSALLLEMGLTTRESDQDRVSGAAAPEGTDPVAEPEIDEHTVQLLVDFIRFLAPPAAKPPRSSAQADTFATGARIFDQIGCPKCHRPTMRTGSMDVPALSRRVIHLYSDLLLHDMGPGLSNVCAHDASPQELRTTPLLGLQHRSFYLHDGRAIDLREAILEHGGEAQASRNAFARLPWLRQEFVVIFLRSL
ncbi:MAG: hypothetical protein L0271_06400 [Gemmatimonadetes bacterium]|nr:hypothetical protein [Gemmatimonadota bacterium]